MAPAPETASRDFMKVVEELWEKNSAVYKISPNQFMDDDIIDNANHAVRNCYKMVMVPGAVDWWLNDFIQTHTTALCNPNEGQMEECAAPVPGSVSEFVLDNDSSELKPNTVVDVYGYLSMPMDTDAEDNSSKLFNVHVLRISEVAHVAPDLTYSSNCNIFSVFYFHVVYGMIPLSFVDQQSLRSDLVKNISYSRPNGSSPLCFMPLNIVGVEDSQAVNSIMELTQHLMPKVKLLTITPDLLSQKRFAPFKDYVSDDLLQGELQLSNGTVLVIDETQLPSGSFPVSGFVEENLKVLEDLVVAQKMEYNYSFYKIPMDVDYNILILSRKESRLFKEIALYFTYEVVLSI
uniref:Mini-chromosome maintenance complex-binding protein n=1 Tax=Angiostrongylus cantonensis TaxID=6313 RepID=A0A158PAC0_ANGCA